MFKKNFIKFLLLIFFFIIIIFIIITYFGLKKLPDTLALTSDPFDKIEFVDRNDEKLLVTYKTKWNVANYVSLSDIPEFLKQVFINIEDKRFYTHHGVDLKARLSALYQLLRLRKIVRGASTISEQTVKMFHKRKRTFFTKWLEGIESYILEKKFSKNEILEFYLNEVPYSRNIRGIKNASLYFFNRELETLSKKEIIALAVMLRSPSTLDPFKNLEKLENAVNKASELLFKDKIISKIELKHIKEERLKIENFKLGTDASHFISFIKKQNIDNDFIKNGKIKTTLDASLQNDVKKALDAEINNLKEKNVRNGGALVVNLKDNEILAWVVGGDLENEEDSQIDAVTILRQPGSTLKPFLYARALEKGYNAATVILDAPIAEEVNKGIHRYKNFSGVYYGPIRLREALANSLNTPAVRTVKFIGDSDFLETLKNLGFENLKKDSEYYGAGLALGNGEVTLYELSRAYATLARSGIYKDFNFLYKDKISQNENFNQQNLNTQKRVFDKDVSDIINDILQDSEARRLEFGTSPIYKFTYPTSFKTGTSSDFRDAWVAAYTQDYLVSVWMGNYKRDSMKRVSGSLGPVSVMRTIFGILNPKRGIKKNYNLKRVAVCPVSGILPSENCPHVEEIFKEGTEPTKICDAKHKNKQKLYNTLKIAYPLNNMTFAIDKRISINRQAINFEIYPLKEKAKVYWSLDGKIVGSSDNQTGAFEWMPKRGEHKLQAIIYKDNKPAYSQEFKFEVK